ncbi:hypothetical protein IGX29_00690 [Streptomyces sp. H28]|uniref:hypothetical protein n=1 Tax=unclassified Streptomyces TaxID=2593676 RepID=UPI0017870FA4|nr:hypothetical protein [Streptomyces sp. H28]MBD9730355.1 hypothetical protein [Streptomyces sp. H28]MBM7087195.1 hypothetical protein [Streptomyces sp. S12]
MGWSPWLTTVLLALTPAVASFLGGLLSEVVPWSGQILSVALHLATGIVIAVVGLELMPRALEVAPAWVTHARLHRRRVDWAA